VLPGTDAQSRRWRVRALGSPEQALRLESAPVRTPAPDQVVVKVAAVGLNFPDLLLCAGRYQERPPLPFSPGYEAAGTIAAAGAEAGHAGGDPVLVVPELPDGAAGRSLTPGCEQLSRDQGDRSRRATSGAGQARADEQLSVSGRAWRWRARPA
jgi:NADPH:quinone reductase